MRIDDQHRLRKLFEEAMDHPGAERSGFLDTACGGDTELRAEIEALIDAYGRADDDGFLEEPTDSLFQRMDPHEAATAPAPAEPPSETIGRYHLLDVLGEGGFGTVYRAHQSAPVDRMVALKLIKLGMDTKRVVNRFEAERQALALMDHPGIAHVFDGGATETGRPYFVMELVKGTPITDYCERNKLDTDARLDLFMAVCQAIQHAHQKGIIHRDLKPSNVLVTMQDGRPVPKVIDFGIAKALDRKLTAETIFTEQRQLIGTPQYMSPEQAEMSLDIDTRSDVYALGVLLYELLTGLTPFDADKLASAGFGEVQRIIREVEPEKPSTRISELFGATPPNQVARPTDQRSLARTLRGDLDWIVMRCLEKDRTRRYETANALADDIERHLNHEPVEASPPSAAYRFRKFARRHRGGLATAAVVALSLVAGLTVATAGFVQASRERDAKAAALAESEAVTDFLETTLASVDPAREGKDVRVHEILDKAAVRVEREFEDYPLIRARLQQIIGATYVALGLYDRAEPHLREAQERFETQLGLDAPRTIDCMGKRLWALSELYRLEEGQILARERLRRARETYGEHNPVSIHSMSALGWLLTHQDRNTEAEQWLVLAVELAREVAAQSPGPVALSSGYSKDDSNIHWVLSDALNCLGTLRWKQRRTADGLSLMHAALELRKQVVGGRHPEVFQMMVNMADMYQGRAELAEADALAREALAGLKEVFGDQNRDVMHTRGILAQIAHRIGRSEEAIAELEAVVSWFQEDSPALDGLALRHMNTLARCYVDLGDAERAEPLLWRSYDSSFGSMKRFAFRNLASFLLEQQRFDEAQELCRAFARSFDGPDVESQDRATTLDVLAWAIVIRPVATDELYDLALAAAEEIVDIDATLDFRNTLGAAQYRTRQYPEALATLSDCDAERSEPAPEDWAFIAMAYHQLGDAEQAQAALETLEGLKYPDRFRIFIEEAEGLIGSASASEVEQANE